LTTLAAMPKLMSFPHEKPVRLMRGFCRNWPGFAGGRAVPAEVKKTKSG
jgi:hypothetical protein